MKSILKNKIKILAGLLAVFVFLPSFATGVFASEVNGVLGGVIIAAPIAAPGSGDFDVAQTVFLVAPGAESIHYVTEDILEVLSCENGFIYTEPINVDSSMVVKAIACYPGNKSSMIAEFSYVINVDEGDNEGEPPENENPAEVIVTGPVGGGGGNILILLQGNLSDINGDGKIDIYDFNILMVNWESEVLPNISDLNSDRAVNLLDFNKLLEDWNE